MILNDPKSFTIDVKGTTTEQSYSGLFKMKPILSHREKLRRDELKRQVLGSNPESATEDSVRTAVIFSKIWIHLTESPAWWREANNGIDLLDEEPVLAVLDKIIELEGEILNKTQKDGEAAKKELTELSKTK